MTLTIDLNPEVAERLKTESRRHGIYEPEYAARLIESGLTSKRHPISLMIDRWNEEDETDDAVELARRQAEWEEFKQAMNESHSSNGPVYR